MEWFHGDKLLKATERYKFIIEGDLRRIEINHVQMNDSGNYTVRVKDEDTHTSGKLIVNGMVCKILG